ncbi:uncharacterized protein LOC143885844 [Tasmannia lanceolata]|uniref:uncharacterized protein LOC143885844 n=1 Tax=Tasmannia lanceolata TaxID=3420 RepID=UPI004062D8A0
MRWQSVTYGSMSNVLQQQHIGIAMASDIMLNINKMFGEQHRTTRLLAIKGLISTKMVKGTPVRDHMLKMMGYLNELDILGAIMDAETQIAIVLSSLCGSFKEFVMNYHMNKMTMSLTELMNQLQTAEDLQKSNKKSAFLAEGNVPSGPKLKGKKSAKDLVVNSAGDLGTKFIGNLVANSVGDLKTGCSHVPD